MKNSLTVVRVPIVRWVDDHNPSIAECHLIDAFGKTWSIIDKLPIFSEAIDLDADSIYPQPGIIACEIVEKYFDEQERSILVIDTARPWGVEAVDGTTQFHVLEKDVEVINSEE